MDSQNQITFMQSLQQRVANKQYQRAYNELQHYQKQNHMSYELYVFKMKLEDKLEKYENSLKSWQIYKIIIAISYYSCNLIHRNYIYLKFNCQRNFLCSQRYQINYSQQNNYFHK
ncbi:hypothetical protein pb186bvf_001797 [Paramecium bursaria]